MKASSWIALPLCLLALHAPAGAPVPNGPLHGPLRIQAQFADGSVISPNWSGYAVTDVAGGITAVSGSWVVPSATCTGGSSPRNAGSSFWVGIDGYTSSTVEQTGTDSDCDSGKPSYYAWYEFYPSPGITIETLSVQPGDVMQASVTYEGADFTVTITDETTQQSFSKTEAVPSAKRNSAEWIAEDNANKLTDFGTAPFGRDYTGVRGTCSVNARPLAGAAATLPYHAITMADSAGTVMASPGPLSQDGSSFSVEWQSAD